jgi:hypothetical protein
MPVGVSKDGTLFEKIQTGRYLSRAEDKQTKNMLTVVAISCMTNCPRPLFFFAFHGYTGVGISVSPSVPYILYERSLDLLAVHVMTSRRSGGN